MMTDIAPNETPNKQEKLELSNLQTLLETEYPPQEWLIDQLIPIDGLTVMSAQPAHYKSWLMLTMAMGVAVGEAFLGTFPTKQGGVLIIDEESGVRQLQERFKKLGASPELPIYFVSRTGREMSDEYVDEIVGVCKEKDISIVMVDSLIRMHHKNENDSSAMAQVLNYFKKLSDNGIACLILHHHRKGGLYAGTAGEAMRGSGDILASVDVHISLARKDNMVTISQTKNRYCEEIKPITATFIKDENGVHFQFNGFQKDKAEEAKELEQSILAFIEEHEGANKSEIIEIFNSESNIPIRKVQQAMENLIEHGEVKTLRGLKNAIQLYINLPNEDKFDEEKIDNTNDGEIVEELFNYE